MKKYNLSKHLTAAALAWAILLMPLAAFSQTRIVAPKNKYPVSKDIEIGRQAAAQVEQQMPILRDAEATQYVQQIGRRLVNAIPPEFQHPEFQYSFQIVNASDINAFALPGGPMFVNRGMIEAAHNEGEMAGVMAHELSHVALRHGTAQATKQSGVGTQLGTIGLILGGAILGGQSGAQLGALGAQAIVTKYSREYETQADTLGAQIMARAGYDPHDLANMFRTIEQQSEGGNRAPEWLSSHPDPGNRYNNINREAQMLHVSANTTQDTREFQRVQNRLSQMPRAQTMSQIEQAAQNGGGSGGYEQGQGQNPMANGRYSNRVEYPSSRYQTFTSGNFIQMSVPDNWQQFPTQNSVWFAPQGAYGDQGITHGMMIGMTQTGSNNLQQATEQYINSLMQEGNNYLKQDTNYTRTSLAGRNAYTTTLSGRSPLTNQEEVVNVVTTLLRNGSLFYAITVAPGNESSSYNNAFRNVLRSIRLND